MCAVLAAAAIPACGRTGLDDPSGLGPGSLGAPAADAESAGDDALPSSSSGGENSSGAGESSSGGSREPAGGNDAGNVFSPAPADSGARGPMQEIDGPGSVQGPGTRTCDPGNCGGCCAYDGTCQSGQATSACGHGGQPCMECEAERSCNDWGICL